MTICNSGTLEVEAEGLRVQSHPQLLREFEAILGYMKLFCIFYTILSGSLHISFLLSSLPLCGFGSLHETGRCIGVMWDSWDVYFYDLKLSTLGSTKHNYRKSSCPSASPGAAGLGCCQFGVVSLLSVWAVVRDP